MKKIKKIVRESLSEWYSTQTHEDIFGKVSLSPKEKENTQDIKDMIPPPTMKMSVEEFSNYIDELIRALPDSPETVIKIFSELIKTHTYLTRRPAGFKTSNPYEPYILKFVQYLR